LSKFRGRHGVGAPLDIAVSFIQTALAVLGLGTFCLVGPGIAGVPAARDKQQPASHLAAAVPHRRANGVRTGPAG
jgi:hypothetical protein